MQSDSAGCDGWICICWHPVDYACAGRECLGISVAESFPGRKPCFVVRAVRCQYWFPPRTDEARLQGGVSDSGHLAGLKPVVLRGKLVSLHWKNSGYIWIIRNLAFLKMFWAFRERAELRSYIWIVWGVLFGLETLMTMGISCSTPGIGFHQTHLNVRMGLLTLIIIGEGVIAVTRVVNKTVRPGGWTKWSFVHILGVTLNLVRCQRRSLSSPPLLFRSC